MMKEGVEGAGVVQDRYNWAVGGAVEGERYLH